MQQIAVAIFAEECHEFGLTCLQYSTLARIRERPGIDVTRLSEIMEFDRSTLGGVVERLEMKGYIRRSGTTNDKRIKLLEVTRQGQAILDQIEPCLGRINRRLLGCLNADEQKILSRLMTRLVMENAHAGGASASKSEQNKVVVPLRGSSRSRRNEASLSRGSRYLSRT
jgi:DNA-binding MarR family transcriptional regulator